MLTAKMATLLDYHLLIAVTVAISVFAKMKWYLWYHFHYLIYG